LGKLVTDPDLRSCVNFLQIDLSYLPCICNVARVVLFNQHFETTIIIPIKKMTKDTKHITTLSRESLGNHRQTERRSNWNIPLSAKITFAQEASISQYQDYSNVYELLVEDQFENRLVFKSSARLLFVLSC